MNIIGIDLALTTTGWANADGHGTIETSKMRGPERLDHIMQAIGVMVFNHTDENEIEDTRVVIEGVSFGSKGNALVDLGKLHGLIEHMLWEARIPYIVGISPKRKTPMWGCPPGTLKKYATGSGNAPKVEMVVSCRERLGHDVLDDNIADALWLRHVGLELVGEPEVQMPKAHRAALSKLRWSTDV